MPIFRVRLEDDAGEFRISTIEAGSKEEARAVLEARERRHVEWYLDADELAELEAKEADGTLAGREKGRLYSHRQAKPYEIVSVEKVG